MASESQLLSSTAKTVFRLNGQFLTIGESLARPAGLTAAWWQVLAAALDEPRSVSDIARMIGVTRQSVQRIADLLVDRDLGVYRPNPTHRRSQLLAPTERGREAVRRIAPAHAALARQLVDKLGREQLEQLVEGLSHLSEVLDTIDLPPRTET